MLRFSSSPTGDMHISELRVALFNYIVSKQRDEDLIVRIDDTDTRRNIEGKDQEILDILDLFGVRYSQTIYQSQNFRFHSAMALQLIHEKKAFSCFCSPEWIGKKIQEAKDANKPYRYDDACANLPHELVIDNLNPFTIRIHKATEDIVINDHVKGKVTFKPVDAQSFMILKQDKTPMPDFACAVDDMLNDISLVIRSEEHLSDTPKQVHVRDSLQYDKKIEYAHLPTIENDSISVKSLLEQGFLPSAIANYIISVGNKPPKEIFTLEESVEWLTLENISKSPTSFNLDVLRDINNKHLKMLDSKELSRYVGFADEEIGELAKIYLDEASTTKELRAKIELIFAKKDIPEQFAVESSLLIKTIKASPYFENYEDFKNYTIKESGLKDESFYMSLRIVLTGSQNGPELAEIYKYIKNYIGEIVK